jgi:DNA-binding NarL/FixJ family response regulator
MINIVIICRLHKDREKIASLLSAHKDFHIAALGKDGYDALQAVENLSPDVIIMDLRLPGISAVELTPLVKRKSPHTAIMTLSSMDQNHVASSAIRSGISAYLLKQEDMDKLAACIRLVYSGGIYVSTSILNRVFSTVSALPGFPLKNQPRSLPFSCSERGIISLLTQGFNDDEIAENLHLHQGTVRNRLADIRRKIGAKNRIQIVVYALIYGLISFESLYYLFT